MQNNTTTVIIVAVLAFGVGFGAGAWSNTPDGTALKASVQGAAETVAGGGAPKSSTPVEGSINIGARLNADQRAMAERFGLDPDNLYLSPAGRACIEGKLGAARVEAIIAGASPSTMEMMSAMPCLNE